MLFSVIKKERRDSLLNNTSDFSAAIFLLTWQDFEADPELKNGVKDLLEEMVCNSCLLPAEHKAAASILRVLTKEDESTKMKVNLDELLAPPTVRVCSSFFLFTTH